MGKSLNNFSACKQSTLHKENILLTKPPFIVISMPIIFFPLHVEKKKIIRDYG